MLWINSHFVLFSFRFSYFLTHTLTHTGSGTGGITGNKRPKDLILPSGNGRKCQQISQKSAFHHLVRMRSPVRIWIAAPRRRSKVCFASTIFLCKKSSAALLPCFSSPQKALRLFGAPHVKPRFGGIFASCYFGWNLPFAPHAAPHAEMPENNQRLSNRISPHILVSAAASVAMRQWRMSRNGRVNLHRHVREQPQELKDRLLFVLNCREDFNLIYQRLRQNEYTDLLPKARIPIRCSMVTVKAAPKPQASLWAMRT